MLKKLLVASDHAGLSLKNPLKEDTPELPWVDYGTDSDASVDYPDYAAKLASHFKEFAEKDQDDSIRGVLICGSGQGMAIMANRYKHIRAALCFTTEMAKLAREHNNANVLCMGARFLDKKSAREILKVFLETPFEGGRHEKRVTKLSNST